MWAFKNIKTKYALVFDVIMHVFTFPTMNTIKYYNLFIAVFRNSDCICIPFNISFVLTVLFTMKMVLIGLVTINTINLLKSLYCYNTT